MSGFISKYLTHTSIYESPTSFWKFSAYTCISAILRDNVYKKQGDKTIYANVYTLLLADSAIQRKGSPVELVEKLVKAVGNTKVISGRTSIQAVFDVLGTAETDKNSGALRKGGSAILFAPELSAGIVNDQQSVAILTDLYDSKDNYREHLRGKGSTVIDKIVFSLLAGSNETLLKGIYNIDAIYGGLLGRTFVVKPDEFRPAASLLGNIDTSQSFKSLVDDLLKIARSIKGEITISEEAAVEYESWYIPFRESYRMKSDNTGIAGRMHTTVIKLSMILAADKLRMTINKEDIEEAIAECMTLIPNYKTFTIASGKSDLAAAGGTLIQALSEAIPVYKLSRKQILRVHWQDIDSETLDKLTKTLDEAGVIKTGVVGNEVTYELTPKALIDLGIKTSIGLERVK